VRKRSLLSLGVKVYLNKGILRRYEKIFELDSSNASSDKARILLLFIDEFFKQ